MTQLNCQQCNRPYAAPDGAQHVQCPYCGAMNHVVHGQPLPPNYSQQTWGQPQYAYGTPGTSDIGVFDTGPSGKSRGVAGLLAILIGTLGVHYFYCGKTGGGLLCILVSFCTCGLVGHHHADPGHHDARNAAGRI